MLRKESPNPGHQGFSEKKKKKKKNPVKHEFPLKKFKAYKETSHYE
jgi:hypothetical protein